MATGKDLYKSNIENISRLIEELFKQNPYCDGDPFGMEKESLKKGLLISQLFYKYYFRCQTQGTENIPKGAVIMAANHGGQLPFDGAMITTALLIESAVPRVPRSMVDRWVSTIPFISNWYSQMGVVPGTPENAALLLKRKEILLTFPEGIKGIQKTFKDAYNLQPFGTGFIRLALANNAPVVPVSVVGSEEQYPTMFTIKRGAHLLNMPHIPIWAHMPIPILGLMPLPVKYYIHFGEPIILKGDPDDDDDIISKMSDLVKDVIAENINILLKKRSSLF
ncbi:MAG: 1-acyl-sn-glycerol-3-phosphate acyltransferase [Deltaproteobacteria bacterium]|nr:1-acyl-sn-glycerol-3-phosphate acyltransferase [Deltaproteobacteria bacterium]